MEGHTTLPEGKNFQRVPQIVTRLIKQDVTQTSAKNNAQGPIEQEVINGLVRPARLWQLFGMDSAHDYKEQKGQQVH